MSCEDYIFYYKKIPNIEEDRQVAGGEAAGLYSVRVIPIFLLTSCMRSIIILDSVFAKKKCRKRGEGKGNGNSCR